MRKSIRIFYWLSVHVFAVIGIVFVGMFFAIRFKLTNVSGSIDSLSEDFQNNTVESRVLGTTTSTTSATNSVVLPSLPAIQEVDTIDSEIEKLAKTKASKVKNLCALEELSYVAPKNVKKIIEAKRSLSSDFLTWQMIFAIETHLVDRTAFETNMNKCTRDFDNKNISEATIYERVRNDESANIFVWPDKKEWLDVMASITKDKAAINKAAQTAGIEPRIIVSSLMVEQLRLFYSQRELYKKYFEPLKMLANSNKISLGVMAIKEETAAAIEAHLKDSGSPYYLGPEYEQLLNYPTEENIGDQRYNRLTSNSNNHYYNYLYGALYLKQFIVQWKNAGYDISLRPEIIGTLFNVGFPQSKPNGNPKVGGSSVQIDTTSYSFGRLSYEFYYSGELLDDFPYQMNNN